jgi:hypothetical protein
MVASHRTERSADPRELLRRAVGERDVEAVTSLVAQHWMYLLEHRSITLALAMGLCAPDPADPLLTAVFTELGAHLKSTFRTNAASHRARWGGARRSEAEALRAVLGGTVAAIAARADGRAAESLAHVDRARAALPAAATRIPPAMLARLQHHWLRTELMSTGYVTVVDGSEEVLRVAVATGQLDIAYCTAGYYALSHALAGRGPAADRAAAEADALADLIEPWQRAAMGVPLRLASALRLLDRGHGDDAAALLTDDRRAEQDSELWALALMVRSQLPAAKQDSTRFLAQLEAEAASWPSDVVAQPANSVHLDVARAQLNGLTGRGARSTTRTGSCASASRRSAQRRTRPPPRRSWKRCSGRAGTGRERQPRCTCSKPPARSRRARTRSRPASSGARSRSHSRTASPGRSSSRGPPCSRSSRS